MGSPIGEAKVQVVAKQSEMTIGASLLPTQRRRKKKRRMHLEAGEDVASVIGSDTRKRRRITSGKSQKLTEKALVPKVLQRARARASLLPLRHLRLHRSQSHRARGAKAKARRLLWKRRKMTRTNRYLRAKAKAKAKLRARPAKLQWSMTRSQRDLRLVERRAARQTSQRKAKAKARDKVKVWLPNLSQKGARKAVLNGESGGVSRVVRCAAMWPGLGSWPRASVGKSIVLS